MAAEERYYEEVEVGGPLPSETKGPVTTDLMVRWAAGSGDFNPIHYDKDWALSQGLPGVVVAGPMKAAMLAHFAARWAGSLHRVKALQCRYRAMDLPGDVLTLGGKVIAKEVTDAGGQVVCEVWTKNQRGEVTTMGSVTLILPRRGG